jgi:hypothetical protein
MSPTLDLSSQLWQTTLEAAKANTLASSTFMVSHLNDELKNLYLSRFGSWTTEVLAGKHDNTNPPTPPGGYAVVTSPDGFAWPAPGTTPVCAMPPVPADHSKSQEQLDAATGKDHISIGVHLSGNYWSALGDDTCKSPFKTPAMPPGADYPAGSVFEKIDFFMGKGWWLKVA